MFLSLFTKGNKMAKLLECHSKHNDLEVIGQWMKEGKFLRVDVDSTFSIRDLELAPKRQNDGSKVGRVILKLHDEWNLME
jgi:hypothetical protein